jgi:hypothetical protein
MKKLSVLLVVIAIIGGSFWLYQHKSNQLLPATTTYTQAVSQPSEQQHTASATTIAQPSLTQMLRDGIQTTAGIIKSEQNEINGITSHQLSLNGKPIAIKAISPITLVKAFAINEQQVMLFNYDQGGNQCSSEYQFLTITNDQYKLSQTFGSCLPLTSLIQEGDQIKLTIPQDHPFLGKDITLTYAYHAGEVKLITKPSPKQYQQKFAQLNASQILAQAAHDGCLVNGVILDDNSCGNGRKYCVMFRAIKAQVHNSDYQLLKEFCN